MLRQRKEIQNIKTCTAGVRTWLKLTWHFKEIAEARRLDSVPGWILCHRVRTIALDVHCCTMLQLKRETAKTRETSARAKKRQEVLKARGQVSGGRASAHVSWQKVLNGSVDNRIAHKSV